MPTERLVHEAQLSSHQSRRWNSIKHLSEPTLPLHFASTWLITHNEITEAGARRAIDTLVTRHEILRTYYPRTSSSDDPKQLIVDHPHYEVDVRHATEDNWKDHVTDVLKQRSEYQPDITRELSWKSVLILVHKRPRCLVFFANHMAVDPYALGILKNEFMALLSNPDPSQFSTALQPRELAELEQSRSRKQRLARAEEYWMKTLDKTAQSRLSEARNKPDRETARRCLITLNTNVSISQLETIASRSLATASSLLLTLTTISLSKLLNRSSVLSLAIFSNRTDPRLRTLVCSIPTFTPILIDVPNQLRFDEFLTQVHHLTTNAYRHALEIDNEIMGEAVRRHGSDISLDCFYQYQPSYSSDKVEDYDARDRDSVIINNISNTGPQKKSSGIALIARNNNGYLHLKIVQNLSECERISLADPIRRNLHIVQENRAILVRELI